MTDTYPTPWREVRFVERTGSTNADLLALAEQGEPSGLVLVAQEQTHGRGRLDREWVSPSGAGLTFSALIRTRRGVGELGPVPLLSGLAMAQAVEAHTGLHTMLKWPNDVMVQDRKLGGVLVQHSPTDALVIGIGINTGLTSDQRPIALATSLLIEGVEPDRRRHVPLLDAMLAALGAALEPVVTDEPWPADLLDAYCERCATLGREVAVRLPSGDLLEGTAIDVDRSGALVVRRSDASQVVVTAGDVVSVR